MSGQFERVLEAVQAKNRAVVSLVRSGSGDVSSDLDLYVLLEDKICGELAASEAQEIELVIRAALLDEGFGVVQPFVLTIDEFLHGERASLNGKRSIDQAFREELIATDVILTEDEVLDSSDYTLTKVAWSFPTAVILAGRDLSGAISRAQYSLPVTVDGCKTWAKLSYLSHLASCKKQRDAVHLRSLAKSYIRLIFSCCVAGECLRLELGNKGSARILTASERTLADGRSTPTFLSHVVERGIGRRHIDQVLVDSMLQFEKSISFMRIDKELLATAGRLREGCELEVDAAAASKCIRMALEDAFNRLMLV